MKNILLALTILFAFGCKTKKAILQAPEFEYQDLDTLVVSAKRIDKTKKYELPVYNASHKKEIDLLHTRLNVQFDWEKEQVIGQASLLFKPYFYPTQFVTLDAKGFDLKKVAVSENGAALEYEYDGQQLTVDLGRTYTRDENATLYIDYIATPSESGGSAAITSDKGLFFINPRGEVGGKPQQIWTQGETEHNSRWFPTVDKPNERCTQELFVTVEDKFVTLSNGLKISSTANADGTRTDYWKMDLPHAPYLFMLAVGEFAVVKDEWEGKLVDYYVEKDYENFARRIFPHTPEMLAFFSEKLGVDYPWQKYSQVVVRDYVSGAMENTTAVIFGEFMQGTDRELVDNMTNDKIVAHEMFHHWFGDLVTCESWANLTMNEGFANYSEYLWLEHKYGRAAADYHWYQELQGYLQQAESNIHPLVHYEYGDKEDMFDQHSYNKGGMVLHMLRHYVGDDAFFAALNLYLTKNKFSEVEADELRLAFEDVTGEDMNWFFNQWYFDQGHPDLKYDWMYNDSTQLLTLTVQQLQDPEQMPPIFQLPLAVDIYKNKDEKLSVNLFVNQRTQSFEYTLDTRPEFVDFDVEKVILGTFEYEKSVDDLLFQTNYTASFMNKFEALSRLKGEPSASATFEQALQEKFWVLRAIAIENILMNERTEAQLNKMITQDDHSVVRQSAIEKLGATGNLDYVPVMKKAIAGDLSDGVVGAALNALVELDKSAAFTEAKKLESSKSGAILAAIGDFYAVENEIGKLAFFENNWQHVESFDAIRFLDNYTYLVSQSDDAQQQKSVEKLVKIAQDMGQSPWRRFGATKGINTLHGATAARIENTSDEKTLENLRAFDTYLLSTIQSIKDMETNGQLRNLYGNFPDPK